MNPYLNEEDARITRRALVDALPLLEMSLCADEKIEAAVVPSFCAMAMHSLCVHMGDAPGPDGPTKVRALMWEFSEILHDKVTPDIEVSTEDGADSAGGLMFNAVAAFVECSAAGDTAGAVRVADAMMLVRGREEGYQDAMMFAGIMLAQFVRGRHGD